MKILKQGNITPQNTPKEVKCYKCQAELEYMHEDVQRDRDGKFIVCPCCKSYIAVD